MFLVSFCSFTRTCEKNLRGQTFQFLSFSPKNYFLCDKSVLYLHVSMRQVEKEEYIYPLASSCISLPTVINSWFL